jgi:vancomycin resistance protein YoaR
LVESQEGFGVDAYASLGAIETAARSGSAELELAGVPLPAEVTVADLGIEDISHVLGTFTTRFPVTEKSRNYNLKLAASKLNGYVLEPGVEFSFNDVVGARTEKEGYKIAHVITAGQMVDGLAGGTCQISSSLHGAAFFAGVGITNSIPHSRPSTYVSMGLDATVVYPHVDLKLKNNYEFPVVIHFKVARGESTVEFLGQERPYDEIAFERKIEERLDFDTVTREDASMPVGSMAVDQAGFYGYKLKRYRKYYKDGKLVKTDTWNLRYRPVTEYVRIGINPDPNLAAPESKDDHKGPKLPKGDFHREVR